MTLKANYSGRPFTLLVFFIVIRHTAQQCIFDPPRDGGRPSEVLPIDIENSPAVFGRRFRIVNNESTLDVLALSDQNFHDYFDHEIRLRTMEDASEYFTFDAKYACRVRTPAATTCLGIDAKDPVRDFLGVFRLREEFESSGTEVEVDKVRNAFDICGYGTFHVFQENEPLENVNTFCSLDDGPIELMANSDYYIAYKADGPSFISGRHAVLFSIPLLTNADVSVTCGLDIPIHQTTPIIGRNPIPDITTSASVIPPVGPEAQKDDSKEDDAISPGMIAVIALLCAVFIAIILVLVVFILWRRNKSQKEVPTSAPAQNSGDPYEQVEVTLARQNTYEDNTMRDVYERINSVEEGSAYDEIPADNEPNGNDQNTDNNPGETRYASITRGSSDRETSYRVNESQYASLSETGEDTTDIKQRVNNDNDYINIQLKNNKTSPENIEELYAKPNKIPKRDELINNSIYQPASRVQSVKKKDTGNEDSISNSYLEIHDGVQSTNEHTAVEQKDSIVKMVNNDVYTGD